MATKARESSTTTPGKEKKTTTSSTHSNTTTTKRPTKPSSTTTTPSDHHKPSSTSSSTPKQAPNYLRPTLSASRHEPSSSSSSSSSKSFTTKKHGPADQDSNKPSVNRRRSFDKPPSPSRLHKALTSPGNSNKPSVHRRSFDKPPSPSRLHKALTSPGKGDPPLRSVSFSAPKSSSSSSGTPKPISKGAKPQPLYAKSEKLKKSSSSVASYVKKGSQGSGVSANSTRRAPKSQDITQTLNLEANLEAIESLDHQEVEEVAKIECEEDQKVVLPDPKVEDYNGHVDHGVDGDQANSGEDEKLNKPSEVHSEISSVNAAEELKENVNDRNEESTGNVISTQEEKAGDGHQNVGGENQNKEEKNSESHEGSENQNPEEGLGVGEETSKVEVKEDEGKESSGHEEDINNGGVEEEAKAVDEKEVEDHVDGGVEEAKAEESKAETKTEEATEAAPKHQVSAADGSQGNKKEAAPAAYNDVIEETANKLLEKRKNKVKALVGAFETVIDYESK